MASYQVVSQTGACAVVQVPEAAPRRLIPGRGNRAVRVAYARPINAAGPLVGMDRTGTATPVTCDRGPERKQPDEDGTGSIRNSTVAKEFGCECESGLFKPYPLRLGA